MPSTVDVEPTRVETHAFANERDERLCGITPAQIDQPRRTVARAADCVHERIIVGKEIFADETAILGTELRSERSRRFSKLCGPKFVRGAVDEIARPGASRRVAQYVRDVDSRRRD